MDRFRKYFGDRAFYRRLMTVLIPILVQNLITNFVSLLDNIMVGQVGTEPMSGVAIVNQLLFVFNLCVFGGLAGAGIFTAQFYGKGDTEGVRRTIRVKLRYALIVVAAALAILLGLRDTLIGFFLHEGEEGLDLAATLGYGREYLAVMLLQLLPFALTQVFAGTLRETGETVLPMRAGIAAVFVNLFFNYVLIFGKLGAPAMGVVGAALATVISRFAELAVILIWCLRRRDRCPYMEGLMRSLRVPPALLRRICVMSAPLLANELLWSSGMTVLNQCYSLRGLEVVSAFNIYITISGLFFCGFLATGSAIGILVGQLLGAGETELAVEEDRRLLMFSVMISLVIGLMMAVLAPLIPQVYNTTEGVKKMARDLLVAGGCFMPLFSYANACYFTLRSGGKTIVTFVFDSLFTWLLCIPLAYVLAHCTAMPVLPMFIAVEGLNVIKCVLGAVLVHKRLWVRNLVAD